MSVTTALRRGLSSAAIPAIAGLVLSGAGGALPSAQAAPVTSAKPGLHTAGKVRLGSSGGLFSDAFTEAPNGTLFYSLGSVVHVVHGNSAPKVALHASRKVLALAATSSDLFVQTKLTVTEYRRSNGSKVRHWRLSSPRTPITSAGLFVVGRTLWSWTDWATDMSGFQFATVSRIRTSSSAVHQISGTAYPGDMAVNSAGLYLEAVRHDGTGHFLIHATPSGSIRRRSNANIDAPVALSGGRVDLLSNRIDTYNRTTLARLSSRPVSADDRGIAATSAGLLVIKQSCPGISCAAASVSRLDATTGSVSGTVHIPHAVILLAGPSAAVIASTGGHIFLVRIAS
jgi:hypothetical protein